MKASTPTVKHLVLIGGGHSHLAVLRSFAMKPMPGLAITMISRDIVTPYSGSLPGYLAGNYSFDEMHIDLRPLAQSAQINLIQSEATKIDLEARNIHLQDRPDIPFDILSLNIGSRPNADAIKGAEQFATAVKPIDNFISRWESWREKAMSSLTAGEEYRIAIVGGGPASVEIAFATQHRIRKDLKSDPEAFARLNITIVSAEDQLLAFHNHKVREFALSELKQRNIDVRLQQPVTAFEENKVICADGTELAADAILYATGASLPAWPFDCGLAQSDDGFIEVSDTLQTTSHDFVFATGDAATVANEPRPKSGVYAVRQGKVLANNLRRFATSKSLQHYFPQRQALALMSMGDGKAIASRGELFFQGPSMGTLKHQIDSRFVRKFTDLPDMAAELNLEPGLVDKSTELQLKQHAMRCAGCGAKVAADVLSDVLKEIESPAKQDIITTPGGIEDASRIQLDDGRILVQSVDYLKSFTYDPWLFARIATLHCLSDLHAMGVKAHSALVMIGIPQGSKRFSRHQLREIMLASKSVLDAEGCDLIGGHSAESEELQLGFCVNGFTDQQATLNKSGAQAGESIILTKALGTGTLLAADMRHKASHNTMVSAFASMLQSNSGAAEIFKEFQASACTDITGFGLAGHLLEIAKASNCSIELDLPAINELPGALEMLQDNIKSSLHQENKLSLKYIDSSVTSENPKLELLFDPQTSGGLVATVPNSEAKACVKALHNQGFEAAAIIGHISEPADDGAHIKF